MYEIFREEDGSYWVITPNGDQIPVFSYEDAVATIAVLEVR